MFCAEWSLVKHEGCKRTITPLYCNSWKCDICQPRRRARLFRQATAGKPDTFITLTCNPAMHDSPEQAAKALSNAVRVIFRRAKARYGYKSIPYLCVFEATIKGWPHLHILARCKWIDQAWLSDQMAELNGAPIVDISRVRTQKNIASYVAKYVGKDPHHFGTTKRYWCTQDWGPPTIPEDRVPDLEEPYFEISKWNWINLAGEAEDNGRHVTWGRNVASYDVEPPEW